MKTWTVDEMLAHKPCLPYDQARLEELWAGRERLSVLDILDLDIPPKDRVWAALQAGDHVEPVKTSILKRLAAYDAEIGRLSSSMASHIFCGSLWPPVAIAVMAASARMIRTANNVNSTIEDMMATKEREFELQIADIRDVVSNFDK
jgi:hypothetical protein